MNHRTMIDNKVWLFGVCWSVWKLFDKYLLEYSPVSELLMLAVCAVGWGLPSMLACARRRVMALDETMSRI